VKDVHDHVPVVDDDPLAERVAVHGERADGVVFFQAFLNLSRDRFEVRFRRAGADDEEIGERRDAAQVEADDVFGFLVRGEFRAEDCELLGVNAEAPCKERGAR